MHEKVEFLGLQFFISMIESETTAMSDLVISSLFLINGLVTLFDMSDTESCRWRLSLAYLKANGSQYHPESVNLYIQLIESYITLLLLMEPVCYFIYLLQLCLRHLILLFPLWVQKNEKLSLYFQRDKAHFYIKSLSCLFGNPKKALWFSGRRVGKELCDDGNTKSFDGWSSFITPSLVRE